MVWGEALSQAQGKMGPLVAVGFAHLGQVIRLCERSPL